MDDGRTEGRTPDHGYTISSPCEPNGSGELINWNTDSEQSLPVVVFLPGDATYSNDPKFSDR